jgi:16S rRNA (adenine1518-N6/adenine1519-N6)-dimethyltransferase
VLTQAYYDVTYLFDVQPHQFDPPPKVMSGVLRLVRKKNEAAITNTVLFKKIVKAGFSQRRKVLRNSLRSVSEYPLERIASELLDKRAEQLSVEEWIATANLLAEVLPTEI